MVHTIKGVKVYNGKVAQNIANYILTHSVDGAYEEFQRPYVCGWFQEDNVWVAFDNSDGNMWVEDFSTENDAKAYALGVINSPADKVGRYHSTAYKHVIDAAIAAIKSKSTDEVYTHVGEVTFMSMDGNGVYYGEWGCEIEDGEFRGLNQEGGEPINYMGYSEIKPESLCEIADDILGGCNLSTMLYELKKDCYRFLKGKQVDNLHNISTNVLDEFADFHFVDIRSIDGYIITDDEGYDWDVRDDMTTDDLVAFCDDIASQLS